MQESLQYVQQNHSGSNVLFSPHLPNPREWRTEAFQRALFHAFHCLLSNQLQKPQYKHQHMPSYFSSRAFPRKNDHIWTKAARPIVPASFWAPMSTLHGLQFVTFSGLCSAGSLTYWPCSFLTTFDYSLVILHHPYNHIHNNKPRNHLPKNASRIFSSRHSQGMKSIQNTILCVRTIIECVFCS